MNDRKDNRREKRSKIRKTVDISSDRQILESDGKLVFYLAMGDNGKIK